jgi:lysyl-tRNA synthetase class 2
MIITNQPSIQDVLFFPQMKPEKKPQIATPEDFVALGVREDLVQLLYKIGIPTVEALAEANPNKIHQDLCSANKKMKLGLKNPSKEDVIGWQQAAEAGN